MLRTYHRNICQKAFGKIFSSRALTIIIESNLAQDRIRGQIGHPEYHFDDNAFDESNIYIENQRDIIWYSTKYSGNLKIAWQAFGRLTHCVQDFYAHTNYIRLWVSKYVTKELPIPTEVNSVQANILHHPDLKSRKIYVWDWLTFIPGLNGLEYRLLPTDSHTHMNLDSPTQGLLFPYAFEAAVKRSNIEFQNISHKLDAKNLAYFKDKCS